MQRGGRRITVQEIISLLKALSDMTRLKILKLIMEHEFSVCELARLLDISQPAVSQHLRRLKTVGLAEEDRRGQWIYYKANLETLEKLALEFRNFCNCPLEELSDFQEILPLLADSEDIKRDCQKPQKDNRQL